MGNLFTTFTNCRILVNGELIEGERLVVSQDDGLILKSTGYIGGEIVDLDDMIIAPGFLELHTNGVNGFHFTNFENETQYSEKLQETAKYYASQGVTGFWATIPTVEEAVYKKILPQLAPKEFESAATLLGVHAEGPYLHPTKAGAHNAANFRLASDPIDTVFGESVRDSSIIKVATVAPDIEASTPLIMSLKSRGIQVSMGHSSATYDQGLSGLSAGATGLTHVFNCMAPFHHRDPGLAGLVSLEDSHVPRPPYYSIVTDGIHLHPRVATLLFRASPQRAIIVSDSTELAGLPDGVYPGHAVFPQMQRKAGNRSVIDGTETLIGSCVTLPQAVKNMIAWTGGDVAQSVRAATENVADFMGITDRGKLQEGRRADFVILDDEGDIKETWIAGNKVWEKN